MRPPAKQAENGAPGGRPERPGACFNEAACKTGGKLLFTGKQMPYTCWLQ